jgi:hypothetical protein
MNKTKTDNLTKMVKDADKILTEAHNQDVKTPKQFAKVFESNPPSTISGAEVKTQVSALNDFSDGKISYSQMRSMCG